MADITNLSEEDQAILDDLVADTPESESKYQDDKPIQQEILCCMLRDKYFMQQSFGLVKPQYFEDRAHILICRIVTELFEVNKRRALPTQVHIEAAIKEELKDNPALFYYLSELEAVINSYDPRASPRETLLARITEFARQQGLRCAIAKVVNMVKTPSSPDKWVKIEDTLKAAMLIGPNTDLGLEYFSSVEERYLRMMEDVETERFTSGFKSIDEGLVGGGMSRGEIGAFMGMPGTGKSVALVKATVQNLQRGKKVLYISLEMDQDKIAERFDAMLTTIGINELKERHAEVVFEVKKVGRILEKQYGEMQDRLYIKQFPAGSADVSMCRSFMSQLALHGFYPDLLVVDYVGEFKDIPGMKKYESLQRVVRDLRALAVEEQICVLTAMQPNRGGRDAQESGGFIDDSEIADAFGQARPMDAIWSINMNKVEQDERIGRIFVVKHRHGKSRYHFHFKQDTSSLDMKEISSKEHTEILNKHVDKAASKTQIDKIEGKFDSHDKG